MDCLTFIVEITKAAAWPIAAVVIGLMFRVPINLLLARMKRASVFGAEADFERELEKAQAAESSLSEKDDEIFAIEDKFKELLSISPDAAVLEKWNEVYNTATEYNKTIGRPARTIELTEHLPSEVQEIYESLKKMKSISRKRKGGGIDINDALQFGALADRFISVLRREIEKHNDNH
jgi:hypothetical protein